MNFSLVFIKEHLQNTEFVLTYKLVKQDIGFLEWALFCVDTNQA